MAKGIRNTPTIPRGGVQYEVYQIWNKDWRWRLRAHNGEILAAATQGYSRKIDAVKTIKVIAGKSPFASVWDSQKQAAISL